MVGFGPSDGVNGSIGAGIGEARARYFAAFTLSNALNSRAAELACHQVLLELRVPVSTNVDVGIKGRYFETLKFGTFCNTSCTTALPYGLSGQYHSFSLLASLAYNFGAVAAPPPPPSPRPPPLPPPAMQACSDGSVIPATGTRRAPPPPPPSLVQRRERGQ